MFDRLRRSWSLLGESWQVLRQDPELIVFPILSGTFSILVVAAFAAPFIMDLLPRVMSGHYGATGDSYRHGAQIGAGWPHYLGMFLYYLVTYFIVVFFNSALIACVRIRLEGGDPSARDGFRFAYANIGRIFQWSLLSATVGAILNALQERAGWIGRLVIGLVGLVWSLATLFVVPVLVHEGVGPIDAVKRSAEVFKRTWGESVVGNIGMGWAFTLLALVPVLPIILAIALCTVLAGSQLAFAALILGVTFLLCIAYWIGLGIVQTALQGIFLTACYRSATTGVVPGGFTTSDIVDAWRAK